MNDVLAMAAEDVDKVEIPRDEKLKTLAEKCRWQVRCEDRVTGLEADLKAAKEDLNYVSQAQIPELMMELGITQFTLRDGTGVGVKAFYGAKITEENEDKAFNWLEDNKHEGIIKGEFTVQYRREDKQRLGQFYELAQEMGFTFKDKLHVHPMTLKAFVKEQIETAPAEGAQPFPRDLFGVFTGFQTKIKRRSA